MRLGFPEQTEKSETLFKGAPHLTYGTKELKQRGREFLLLRTTIAPSVKSCGLPNDQTYTSQFKMTIDKHLI